MIRSSSLAARTRMTPRQGGIVGGVATISCSIRKNRSMSEREDVRSIIRQELERALTNGTFIPIRPVWLTAQETAAYSRRHAVSVRRALADGSLHGYQQSKRSPWSIHIDCADAWVKQEACSHRIMPAGELRRPS